MSGYSLLHPFLSSQAGLPTPCYICGCWGQVVSCPQYPRPTVSHPAFLRAHLQGDCELQPHCPEGLAAPKWHEAAMTHLADLWLRPGITT